MPDEPAPETGTPPPAKPAEPAPQDWQAEAEKWKELSRKNEAQAKSNADAAKKLAAIEDANKTETQKLSEERDSHRSRAEQAESIASKWEVGLEKGLTKSQAKRLVGSTREELEADADEMIAELGGTPDKPGPARRPTERLRGGGAPEADPEETDPRKLAAKIPRF